MTMRVSSSSGTREPHRRRTTGPRLRRQVDYHADGYLAHQLLHQGDDAIADTAYAYDPAGRLVERDDLSTGSEQFWCDPLRHIIQQLTPDGALARLRMRRRRRSILDRRR
jgi:YD repeat-containing protein